MLAPGPEERLVRISTSESGTATSALTGIGSSMRSRYPPAEGAVAAPILPPHPDGKD